MKTAILILLATACAAQAQEFRETAVPNSQIPAVIHDVAEWHDMQHPDCRFVKAIGSTTIQQDSDGSDERWTIEACAGKTFAYSVVVFPEVGGGITDMVGNVDSNTPDDDNRASPALSQEECAETRKQFDTLVASKDPNKDSSGMAQLAANLAVCNSQKH